MGESTSNDGFRQYLPGFDLSVERNTIAVRNDGYYYVLHAGAVVGRFKSYKAAVAHYMSLAIAAGYEKPKPVPRERPVYDSLEHDALRWAERHTVDTRRGGKY